MKCGKGRGKGARAFKEEKRLVDCLHVFGQKRKKRLVDIEEDEQANCCIGKVERAKAVKREERREKKNLASDEKDVLISLVC